MFLPGSESVCIGALKETKHFTKLFPGLIGVQDMTGMTTT